MTETSRGYWAIAGALLLVIVVIAWVWHRRDLEANYRIMERSARMGLGLQQPEVPQVTWTPTTVTPPITVDVPPAVTPVPPLPVPNTAARRTWKCDVHQGYCP